MKNLIENRKVGFDFDILDKFEAGIVLTGKEVKSLRNKRGKLEGSYGIITGNEIFILNLDIPVYQPRNSMGQVEPSRTRKLLLKRKEINYLIGKMNEKRLTLIPRKIYSKNNKIKVELILGKGRTKIDKRNVIKKRETEREMRREQVIF